MNVRTLAIGSLGAGIVVGAALRLGLDSAFDGRRQPVVAARDEARRRLDTETLDPATRARLQATVEQHVPVTASVVDLGIAGAAGLTFGFGASMAEMGGGFATAWKPINAVTGPLAAGVLGGLLLGTIIDRD